MKTNASILLLFLLTFHASRGQQVNGSFLLDRHFGDSVTPLDSGHVDSILAITSHHLDSGIVTLNKAIDSTYSLVMSPQDYHVRAAQLYEKFDTDFLQDTGVMDNTNGELRARIEGLKAEVARKKALLDSLLASNEFFDLHEVKSKLILPEAVDGHERLISNLHGFPRVPGVASQIPAINVPGYDHLQSLDVIDQRNDVSKALQNIKKISDRTKPNIDKLKDLNRMAVISAAQVGAVAEQQLLNSTEGEAVVQTVGSSKEMEDELGGTTELMKEPKQLREEGMRPTRKKYVDHFAGHEDKISSEIQSMEKLQRKYHSVADVRYLPKRRTNPEKEKPFVERLILGTGFHVDSKDTKWTGLDIAPYAGYKFSDRFRACLGGTYRVAVDMQNLEFSRTDKTFGYRTFANYRIFNGLFAHLEVEARKTTIPSWFSHSLKHKDANEALWVPMAYAGIIKTYSLGRRFHGQTQMLYDFLAVSRNFDFNKITFRFGFEYKLQKRKRPGIVSTN